MRALYSSIVDGNYSDVIKLSNTDPYILCCQSLAHAQLGNVPESKNILERLDFLALTPEEQSIYLEAKAVIAYLRRDETDAKKLAETALDLNKSAVIAHTILGRYAEQHRLNREALKHFEAIVGVYPNYEAALFACVRMLFFIRKPQQAFDYLKRIPTSSKKRLYNLFVAIYFRNRLLTVLFILGLFTLIIFPYCYYALTGLFVLGYLTVVLCFKSDAFLLRAMIITELEATIFFLTVNFLRWVSN